MFPSLPSYLNDLASALAVGLLLVFVLISARQDISASLTSAATQWVFGGIVVAIRLVSSTERPLEFFSLLVIAIAYSGVAAKTYQGYAASLARKEGATRNEA